MKRICRHTHTQWTKKSQNKTKRKILNFHREVLSMTWIFFYLRITLTTFWLMDTDQRSFIFFHFLKGVELMGILIGEELILLVNNCKMRWNKKNQFTFKYKRKLLHYHLPSALVYDTISNQFINYIWIFGIIKCIHRFLITKTILYFACVNVISNLLYVLNKFDENTKGNLIFDVNEHPYQSWTTGKYILNGVEDDVFFWQHNGKY